ncbi:MAG: hypothetical protein SFZ03_02260 [Candidatus Melainabacteria bacterium]|nr:hypothetical protein [Candidatus Melainabacteria bacterium]
MRLYVTLSQPGQSIAEYCILLGILSAIGFFGLTLFGQQMAFTMPSLVQFSGSSAGNAPSLLTGGSPQGPTSSLPTNSGTPASAAAQALQQQLAADLASAGVIETGAASGQTASQAYALKQTVYNLLNTNQMDPQQANALIALSNQALKMATIQGLLEQAAVHQAQLPPGSTMQIQFNGQYYTPAQLAGSIAQNSQGNFGYWATFGNIGSVQQHPNLFGQDLVQFANLYQQATAGLQQSPTVQQYVKTLSSQVLNLSQTTSHNYSKGMLHPQSPQLSYQTTQHGNQICYTGNGSVSNMVCF